MARPKRGGFGVDTSKLNIPIQDPGSASGPTGSRFPIKLLIGGIAIFGAIAVIWFIKND